MESEPSDEHFIEPISREDWEQREVYAHFGLAIYFGQVLESNVVTFVAHLRRAQTGRPMTDEEVDGLLDQLFGRTFGSNLRELRNLLGDEWAMTRTLADALALRNDLVHHWKRDRALQQGTSAKRRAMVEELQEAQSRLRDADAKLIERLSRFQERVGVTREMIEAEYERLRRIADKDGE